MTLGRFSQRRWNPEAGKEPAVTAGLLNFAFLPIPTEGGASRIWQDP